MFALQTIHRIMPIKKKYVEQEAAHSGDESSQGSSSGSSDDDYEKGSFVVSDKDESGDEDNVQKLRNAQRDESMETTKQKKPRVSKDSAKADTHDAKPKESYKPKGNKSMDIRHVPPQPVLHQEAKKAPKFRWSILFSNARFAQNFWEVASKALPYLFFHIEVRDDYAGLRLEAHDTPPTMAIKSHMECIIEEGVDEHGNPLDRASLNGEHFCVKSKSLMKCFKCGTLKDTPLRLTKMNENDGVIFEASTDESDMRTRYLLPFYTKAPSTILSKISSDSDIQIKIATHILQKLGDIASSVETDVLKFDLYGSNSDNKDITRNKLTVQFDGEEIKGSHSFFLSTKKSTVDGVEELEPVSCEIPGIKWSLLSSNCYNANKFKLFISNLDIRWCMLGLATKPGGKPLIVIADSTETGANKTSHAVFISPQHSEES